MDALKDIVVALINGVASIISAWIGRPQVAPASDKSTPKIPLPIRGKIAVWFFFIALMLLFLWAFYSALFTGLIPGLSENAGFLYLAAICLVVSMVLMYSAAKWMEREANRRKRQMELT